MYEVSLNDSESRYDDIMFYLKNGYAPPHLNYTKRRFVRLKDKQYQIVNDILFRMNYDSFLLRFLKKVEIKKVLQELHDGLVGGKYVGDVRAQQILGTGYYWPTLFKYAHRYVRRCQIC